MYKWGNEKALFRNKEAQYSKAMDSLIVGYSAARSDIQEKVNATIKKSFLAKEQAYTAYAQAARGQGMYRTGEAGSRAAGRRQFLALMNKYKDIEYAVHETSTTGQAKGQQNAMKGLKTRGNKFLSQLGVAPIPPMLQGQIGKDRSGQFMGTLQNLMEIAPIVAAPFTGGASLGIPGIGKLPTSKPPIDYANLGKSWGAGLIKW